MALTVSMITTMDNPYNYWTEFDEWYAFDTSHGYEILGQPYNTLNYIARIANTDSDMSPKDYNEAVNHAVDEIFRLNLTGNYKKIYKEENDNNDEA